jgi:apolipoprotein N-acyltransferase
MALAYAAAAPPVGVWPFAFVCGVPLLLVLRGRGLAARAGIGFAAGTAVSALTALVPLAGALARYFEVSRAVSGPAALLVVALFGGGGFAVFAALAGDPARAGSLGGVPRQAAAWVAGDLYRTVAFTGLPWLLLGQLLAPSPPLQALASLGGLPLLSFWVAAVNAALALALGAGRWRPAVAWGGFLALVGVAAACSDGPLAPAEPGSVAVAEAGRAVPEGALRIALVQPAVPPEWRKDLSRVTALRDRLVELSARAGPVDLLVWPENALPVHLPSNRAIVDQALAALPAPPGHLLLGAPRAAAGGGTANAAFLVGGDGRFVDHHDKVHRVPFTEYVPAPFAGRVPFLPKVARIEAGAAPRPLRVGQRATLGPLVCYEMLFPDLARALVRGGADVLVNLSHDGYFGGDAGAHQHLAAAILRAAELRRPVLRATSDGITVAVDASGRVVAELEARRPGLLLVDVWPSRRDRPGARIGGGVAWLLALGALAASVIEERAARRKPEPIA